MIKRFTENITILYDGDEAGIKASFRGIDMILEEGMNVKVVMLPAGEDPDSYASHTVHQNSSNSSRSMKKISSLSKLKFYCQMLSMIPLKGAS